MKLINKLRDKMDKLGKEVILTEESYTSKCDTLNMEEICKKKTYDGIRTRRGLFLSKTKRFINADINGAINIGRKYMNKINYPINGLNEKGIFNPIKIRKL